MMDVDEHKQDQRTPLSLRKKIVFVIILVILVAGIVVLSVEVISLVYIKRLGWNYEPAYLRILKGYTSSNLVGGRTEYHSWGSWNVPHYTGRIANNCFDVKYTFNSYGARDRERSRQAAGKERTIVLGDSFTEGWGVDQDKILAAHLERATGKEYLNFGVAGSGTGPLNEYVLYRDLAQKFEHDTVLVGMYLGNDFRDNDPAIWSGLTKVYYRPFWQLTDDKEDVEIKYFAHQVKGQFLPGLEPSNKAAHFKVYESTREFSAFLNLLEVYKNRKISLSKDANATYAYRLNVSDDSLTATKIIMNKFADLATDKKRYIFMIPAATDVFNYQKSGKKSIPKLESFKDTLRSQGWGVIDTMDVFGALPEEEVKDYFICDGHWNDRGNELAAKYILKQMSKKEKPHTQKD